MKNKNRIISIIKVIIFVVCFIFITSSKYIQGYGQWQELGGGRYLCDMSVFNNICGYNTYVPNQHGGAGYATIYYGDVNARRRQLSGSFQITMSSNMVYCSDNNRITRNGKFDTKTYYMADYVSAPGTTTGSISDGKDKAERAVAAYHDKSNINEALENLTGDYGAYFRDEPGGLANDKASGAKLYKGVRARGVTGFNTGAKVYIFQASIPMAVSSTSEISRHLSIISRARENATAASKNMMGHIFNIITGKEKVDTISAEADVNGKGTKEQGSGSEAIGPMVSIMQTSAGNYPNKPNVYKERGYTGSGVTYNDARAYVLTGARKIYDPTDYEYTPIDIQVAWWNLVDVGSTYSLGGRLGDGSLGRSFYGPGMTLKTSAVAWDSFRKIYNTKEKVASVFTIDKSQAEAIINHDRKEYTIGPFRIDYPDQYEDFMYVKGFSILLKDENGNTKRLNYNEAEQNFKFVYPPGHSGIKGKNGMQQTYPRRKNMFYVRFDLNMTGNLKPISIDLTASIEYLSAASVSTILYEAKARTYPYIGHYVPIESREYAKESDFDKYDSHTKYHMPFEEIIVSILYNNWVQNGTQNDYDKPLYMHYVHYYTKDGINNESNYKFSTEYNPVTGVTRWINKNTGRIVSNPVWDWTDLTVEEYGGRVGWAQKPYYEWDGIEHEFRVYSSVYIFQPYVKLSRKWYSQDKAQPFTEAKSGSRTYTLVDKTEHLDFTMRVGGFVYEDVRTGKSNLSNGTYGVGDKKIPNVLVALYRHEVGTSNNLRGTFYKSTITDQNGEYSFKNLNEMYKYHVEIIYNGQYYEPTKITTEATFNSRSAPAWENASKAIDNNKERDNFNKKFEEVGSAPLNVVRANDINNNENRIFQYLSGTKDKLIAENTIDGYGNLKGLSLDSSGNYKYNGTTSYSGYAFNSMLRAYSARENASKNMIYDMYPFKPIFISAKTIKSPHQSVINTGTIAPLYGTTDTEKNLTEKINCGLVKREEIDFALKKDVFNITFEMNGKKFVYKYHTRYESIPPEGMTMEELIRKNGIKSALEAASEIHINNLTYKVNYSVLTRKGNDNKYAYYKEEDTRLVYREDYEYNSGLYRNLKVQNADGSTSQMTGREYDELIEAKEKGELEIYVTYVITLRNFSSGLNGRVTEIVDHSDSEFTLITSSPTCTAAENSRNKVVQGKVLQSEVDKYRPYIGTGLKGEKLSNDKLNAMGIRAEQQFSQMINITGTGNNKRYTLKNQNLIYLTTSENSIYKTGENKNVESENFEQNGEYNTAYITGMENVYLTVLYNNVDLYLTYRINKRRSNVNGDNNDYLILDERIPGLPIEMSSTNPKSNLAEIRGYKTYYSTYATAPNRNNAANKVNEEFVKGSDMYGTDDVAGILDLNSTPGNLKYAAREDEKPNDGRVSQEILNVVKENDADRAPLLRLVLNMDRAREVNGSTFEDARTVDNSNTKVGDGIKKFTFDADGNYATGSDRAINGTRVQLVELVGNTEVIWKEVKVGDKENLTPVVDQYGLIGTYNLENTYYKTKTGTTKTVTTGLVDNDTSIANDTTGHYRLLGFPTGDFIVRFIYGSDADTAVGSYGYDYTVVTNKTDNGRYPLTNEIESLAAYDSLSGIRLPPLADNNSAPTGNNNPYKNAKYYYRYDEFRANEAADRSVNQNSYTGNDYKSTVYRADYYEAKNNQHTIDDTMEKARGLTPQQIDAYNNRIISNTIDYDAAETGKYEFDFAINDNGKLLSDAKDIYSRRKEVIDYSDNDQINHIAEVLASFEEKQDATGIANLLNELYNRTYMYADTGVIHVTTEYNSTERDMAKNDHSVGKSNYSGTGFFSISNLDFGLEERPKAQLKTNVQVANVKITMANNNVLFDATKTATNLQWNRHLGHGQDKGNIYTRGANYNSTFMKIPEVRAGNARGVVLATMDQETLQGATIEITYIVTVANIGEIDYYQEDRTVSGRKVPYCSWYNKHKTDNINIVTTKAKELVCYVGTQTIEGGETTNNKVQFSRNNLRFVKEDNDPVWEIVEVKNICKENEEATNIVNSRYFSLLKKYNTIIHTTNASAFYQKDLVPVMAERKDYDGDFLASDIPSAIENDPLNAVEKINKTDSVVGEKLKLVSTLSGDFSTNDMTYNNLVELVRIDNKVGRRMAFSIVGNQNPTADPREIDADFGEEISILPPYGDTQFDYYLGFGLAGIMILGGMLVMIFVRKKD